MGGSRRRREGGRERGRQEGREGGMEERGMGVSDYKMWVWSDRPS